MRLPTACVAVVLTALVAMPALASFSGGKPKDPAPSAPATPAPGSTATATSRQEAEKWYGDAYGDVAKANKDVAEGKAKNAEKRFRRALERGERAVALDSTYHEALNLVGYCARNLKLYPQSLAAYQRCLALKEDYVPAREYLGELYLETGDLEKAEEQLAWLEKLEAEFEVQDLKAKIEARRAATGVGAASGAADSTTAKGAEK
jgi:tetratricopeptide (TPR) repeat protein